MSDFIILFFLIGFIAGKTVPSIINNLFWWVGSKKWNERPISYPGRRKKVSEVSDGN